MVMDTGSSVRNRYQQMPMVPMLKVTSIYWN